MKRHSQKRFKHPNHPSQSHFRENKPPAAATFIPPPPPPEDDDYDDMPVVGPDAYPSLLQSLKSSKSQFTSLVRRRLQENQGRSDDEEEEDEEEEEEREALPPPAKRKKKKKAAVTQEQDDAVPPLDATDNDDEEMNVATMMQEDRAKHEAALRAADEDGLAGLGPDAFETHFSRHLSDQDIATLTSSSHVKYTDVSDAALDSFLNLWPHARWQRMDPIASTTSTAPPMLASLEQAHVKERLKARWKEVVHGSSSSSSASSPLAFASEQQAAFYSVISTYADVLMTEQPYPTVKHADDGIMDACLLHALNHVAKVADRVKKNNASAERIKSENLQEDVPRDQGFSRAKVLILLPMRNRALIVAKRLIQLAIKETRKDSVQRKEKFVNEFTADSSDDDDDDHDGGKKPSLAMAKPEDHVALFAGNLDDHFRLGVKVTRGAIRLFADLDDADILLLSPLALVTKLEEARKAKNQGLLDFLSSIEVLILDRADVLSMQNWSHVHSSLEALNRLPEQQGKVDIMRVREWYLAGLARHYRQTIILSSFPTAEMQASFARLCFNHAGKWRLIATQSPGVLSLVRAPVKQLFERIHAASIASSADDRFHYFTSTLWPRIKESGLPGQCIVIPSYFDFVRIRNYLREQDVSFAALSEYNSGPEAARARSYFYQNRRNVLLYTERAHFYQRHRIRGIRDLIFYSLPEHANYYAELVNLVEERTALGGEHHATVTAIFTKFDALQLGRIVGVGRSKKMIKGEGGTFMFC